MADEERRCAHMDGCPMYSLFNLSGTLAVWQVRYCTAEYESCERYTRARAGQPVPQNLLPNGSLLNK